MKSKRAAVSYTLSCGWNVARNVAVDVCCCCFCCGWGSFWYHPPLLLETIVESGGIGPGTTGARGGGWECGMEARDEADGGACVIDCCCICWGDVDRWNWLTPKWWNAPSMRVNFRGGGADGDGLPSTALGVLSPSPDDVPLYKEQVNSLSFKLVALKKNNNSYKTYNLKFEI